jgi:hypothetical protein
MLLDIAQGNMDVPLTFAAENEDECLPLAATLFVLFVSLTLIPSLNPQTRKIGLPIEWKKRDFKVDYVTSSLRKLRVHRRMVVRGVWLCWVRQKHIGFQPLATVESITVW